MRLRFRLRCRRCFCAEKKHGPASWIFCTLESCRAHLRRSFTAPTPLISWLGSTLRAHHSRRTAVALSAPAGLLRRAGRDGMDLRPRSDGLHSAGGPGLLHGDHAGASGFFAGLHHAVGGSRRSDHRDRAATWSAVFHHWLLAFPAARQTTA